ncbi:MAG: branched-chain amino acid ABC transporter permease, partial [Zetaproteobacteria bacterium]|nr:branched-chain amino acid ABC transporter permease [Zetaproteobacteria bacterium]
MFLVLHLLILISIFAILGISLNLVVGETGLLSVTHAVFYGVGAYTTAILTKSFGWNFFLSIPAGILIALLIALLIGLVFSKFGGDYYALATLGFNMIMFGVMLNWHELTNGPLGITGVAKPELFGFAFKERATFLLLVVIFLSLTYWAAEWIKKSSFGR